MGLNDVFSLVLTISAGQGGCKGHVFLFLTRIFMGVDPKSN